MLIFYSNRSYLTKAFDVKTCRGAPSIRRFIRVYRPRSVTCVSASAHPVCPTSFFFLNSAERFLVDCLFLSSRLAISLFHGDGFQDQHLHVGAFSIPRQAPRLTTLRVVVVSMYGTEIGGWMVEWLQRRWFVVLFYSTLYTMMTFLLF